MITFVDKKTKKKEKVTYQKVAQEFLDSPVSEEERGFLVNMMIYLDFVERRRGLVVEKLNSVDWEELYQATILLNADLAKEVA